MKTISLVEYSKINHYQVYSLKIQIENLQFGISLFIIVSKEIFLHEILFLIE